MKDLKHAIYWRKQQVRQFGGHMIDKLAVLALTVIALPFILLGGLLYWIDRGFGGVE